MGFRLGCTAATLHGMAVVDRVAAPDEATAQAPPRRRWGRWVLAVLAVVVIAVGIGVALRDYYAAGAAVQAGGGTVYVASEDVRVKATGNVLGTEYAVVRPQGGDAVSAWFGLKNVGDRPVTITAIGFPSWMTGDPHHVGYLKSTQAFLSPDGGGIANQLLTSRALAADTYVQAKVVLTFASCGNREPGTTWVTDVSVTYEMSGRTFSTQVPLGYALALRAPGQCGVGTS